MSYARWSKDSDVYVYFSVGKDDRGDFLTCRLCPLNGHQAFDAWNTADMVEHLETHEAAGHKVPNDLIADLVADDVQNFPREGS